MELSPKDTISTTWLVCSPETVGRFSGVAYFFARKVYEETNIPIGIINSSWGGTIVETWTSLEAANTLPQKRLDRYNKNEKLSPLQNTLHEQIRKQSVMIIHHWYTMQ